MKKWTSFVITLVSILLANSIYASVNRDDSLIGYWKTIDDVSGQAKSIIQISRSENNNLYGKVVKLFQDPKRRCTTCQDDRRNQPILGMIVLKGLVKSKENDHRWENGQILDPKNGKIYHCNIQVIENAQKLTIRGYIGLPLFGRSQTWLRVNRLD